MLKLSAAISGWTPARNAADSKPLLLLEAGWAEIVGPQVAENSHPSRISDGTLLITTQSSAWSHELSLLGERVLRAVVARLPQAGVKQLRFRVGALPQRSRAAAPARPARRARGLVARIEPVSPGEALERFKAQVEESHRVKRSEGWKDCRKCGVLVAPGTQPFCAACVASRTRQHAEAAARLLFEAPWLGYTGTAALVDGLEEEEYERIRAQLLTHWWGILVRARAAKRLSRDGRERLVASSYVLLKSKIRPEEIIPATVRNILGDELHDLIYTSEQQRR
jgi:hypothetical protein